MNSKTLGIEKRGRPRKEPANAVKHGMSAMTTLLPGENERHYIELREGLVTSLKPVGSVEEELVERVAGVMWRLRRIGNMEADILNDLTGESKIRQKETRVEWLSKMVSEDFVDGYQRGRNEKAYLERREVIEEIRQLRKVEREPSLGQGLLLEETDRSFGLLRRYESRLERSLYLALGQLRQLQAERKLEEKAANRVVTLPKVTLVSNGQLRECEWQPEE